MARAPGTAGDNLSAGDPDMHAEVAPGWPRPTAWRRGSPAQRAPPARRRCHARRGTNTAMTQSPMCLSYPTAMLLDESVDPVRRNGRAAHAPPRRRARGSGRCSRRDRRTAPSLGATRPQPRPRAGERVPCSARPDAQPGDRVEQPTAVSDRGDAEILPRSGGRVGPGPRRPRRRRERIARSGSSPSRVSRGRDVHFDPRPTFRRHAAT